MNYISRKIKNSFLFIRTVKRSLPIHQLRIFFFMEKFNEWELLIFSCLFHFNQKSYCCLSIDYNLYTNN